MAREPKLADHDPADRCGFEDERAVQAELETDLARLSKLQERLAAEARHGVLVVLQGIDAAGKDGTIKHVMRGLNPQGVFVHSFREPSREELAHDYLWRAGRALPERGRIAVFNRSYYEEVLVTRVHPELLEPERLPKEPSGGALWKARYKQIRRFEHYLDANGFVVRKFMLHISREEQARRLLERVRDPHKHWKFSSTDLAVHGQYDRYARVYDEMLRHTSTRWAPWEIVPADHKWVAHLRVARTLVKTLEALDPRYPATPPERAAGIAAARVALERELGEG